MLRTQLCQIGFSDQKAAAPAPQPPRWHLVRLQHLGWPTQGPLPDGTWFAYKRQGWLPVDGIWFAYKHQGWPETATPEIVLIFFGPEYYVAVPQVGQNFEPG